MRRSRQDAADTRTKIVEAASRLFRSRGIGAVSVADIMSSLGLTVGGFYRHFASKEALVVEAIESASRETAARQSTLDDYLSTLHCEHPEQGCPVAALCSEVAHQGRTTRQAFTVALERLLAGVDDATADDSPERRKTVLATAATLVGAVVLARASSNGVLAGEILGAARDQLAGDDEHRKKQRRRN